SYVSCARTRTFLASALRSARRSPSRHTRGGDGEMGIRGRGLAAAILAALTALPTTLVIGTASPAAAAPAPTAARQADSFVDSIGVATHLTYGDQVYGNTPMVMTRLKEAGIRHIRDGWGPGSQYAFDYLAGQGIKVTFIPGYPTASWTLDSMVP